MSQHARENPEEYRRKELEHVPAAWPKSTPSEPTPERAEALAQRFHAIYESLAALYSYSTRPESAVDWAKVPEKNKKLMIATCGAVLASPEIAAFTALAVRQAVEAREAEMERLKDRERNEVRFWKARSTRFSMSEVVKILNLLRQEGQKHDDTFDYHKFIDLTNDLQQDFRAQHSDDEETARQLTEHAEAAGVSPDHIDYIEETTKAILRLYGEASDARASLTAALAERDALAALVAARWQPMETAPRDGTAVLAMTPTGNGTMRVEIIKYSPAHESWWVLDSHPIPSPRNPTSWQSLPPAKGVS